MVFAILRPLKPELHLPNDGHVVEHLLAHCERGIRDIEEKERAFSKRDSSSIIVHILFNASVTLVMLLNHPKAHDAFARTCRLIRDRVEEIPFTWFLLHGLLAMASDKGVQIPEVAKSSFEGLQLDESMLEDVPISFMVPSFGDLGLVGGRSGVGVELGNLILKSSCREPSRTHT